MREYLKGEVQTCYEAGWSTLSNGELLAKAKVGFDVFVTTDKNIRYQQNVRSRKISIFVLPTTRWPLLKPHATAINEAIAAIHPDEYHEWEIPVL